MFPIKNKKRIKLEPNFISFKENEYYSYSHDMGFTGPKFYMVFLTERIKSLILLSNSYNLFT